MRIDEFKVETWLNPRDHACKYNLGASCVKAFTVEELLALCGAPVNDFCDQLKKMSLHYGPFYGLERLKGAIGKMYRDVLPEQVLTVHGGTGANNLVMTELLQPGDNVVAILPNYQQHYAIPQSLGCEVRRYVLTKENGYLPDFAQLEKLVDHNTRMITLSNPNNPTGAFLEEQPLKQLCDLAAGVGAYLLCDEIYRGLSDTYMVSACDLYDKALVTCSTSKVFSMAGTRVGWIIAKNCQDFERLENRRSYDTICDGVFDEWITAIALEHYEKILQRSRSLVRENRAILDAWLARQPHLSTLPQSFSTTAFITYDYDIPCEELCHDLYEKTGVLLCHGGCFEMPRSFRLGYGFGDPEKFRAGLQVLEDYLRELTVPR